jgi:cytochrome P450
VLRHDALVALLADRRLVQGSHQLLTVQGVTEGPIVEWMNAILLSIEGADHARIRRLVSRAFTPRSVAALRPRMRAIAHDLVARFPAGRMELMGDFARPYAAEVLCELLGVPPGRRDAFRGWADDLGLAFSYQVRAHLERIEAALRGLNAAAEELIADRRADPGGDLLSELVAAEEDGDRLSSAELRLLVSTLLFAGQDTTSHQLGHAVALLLDHSEHWDLIAGRPDGAERVVEEVLRVAPTVPATGRIALVDLDVDGIPVPAGTRMSMFLAAGNTDPATYGPDADAFDPTACRAAAPLTFGAGVHYCLGANLARASWPRPCARWRAWARSRPTARPAGGPRWASLGRTTYPSAGRRGRPRRGQAAPHPRHRSARRPAHPRVRPPAPLRRLGPGLGAGRHRRAAHRHGGVQPRRVPDREGFPGSVPAPPPDARPHAYS